MKRITLALLIALPLTNVTFHEQIARVTLWTRDAQPAFTFDIFLTGYDVQQVDLFPLLTRGELPLTRLWSGDSPEGEYSSDTANPAVSEETCRSLPSRPPAGVAARFTSGGIASGYATIRATGNTVM